MGELEGRVALVTGSSSGIGEATARRLAELGANVVVNSSSSVEAGQAVAEALPTESIYVQADISDQQQGAQLLAATIERFGRLDILVNNAGWTTQVPHTDLDALTDEIFRKTFDVNVFGTWWLTKAAVPHLRQSSDGNVVTVTSLAGSRPAGSSIAYAMTKAALNHMTRLLAKSHGPVRFNAVAPGSGRHAVDGGLDRRPRRGGGHRAAPPLVDARGAGRGRAGLRPQHLHDRRGPRRRRRARPGALRFSVVSGSASRRWHRRGGGTTRCRSRRGAVEEHLAGAAHTRPRSATGRRAARSTSRTTCRAVMSDQAWAT